ncbi:TetR/AcrR family transcriptional regulator [Brevundimonas sp. M20]|uniref:TetR/AcrR family transcriptional regulator n=1 Tax=Brevundimonas sp. M20 TaxID=2591463 RepID=UPI0011475102|nr:TetR/AcrR family transcriptional regulator [Brevundimonas sp. M20]QDH72856.1 TetR/AcrR family transcriptional regulator [Brevundimonas sp. M20]
MSIVASGRRRRTPDEARSEALVFARRRLLDGGPDAVTLKAVADDLGMSHANLIHHFGSAAGLQSALMGSMVSDLAQALDAAIARLRTDEGAPLELINAVFDAFDRGGAAKLAAWIVLRGDLSHLDPVRDAVTNLVDAVREKLGDPDGQAHTRIPAAVLFIAVSAFGEALIGPPLRKMLDQDDESGRQIIAGLLPHFLLKPDAV